MGSRRGSVVYSKFILMAVQDLTWRSGSAGSVRVTYDAAQSFGEQEVSISTSDNTALVERQMTVVLSTGTSSPSGRSTWAPAQARILVSQADGRGSLVRTYYKISFSSIAYSSEGASGPFTDL